MERGVGKFGGKMYDIVSIWGRCRRQNTTFHSPNMFSSPSVTHASRELMKYRGPGGPEEGPVQAGGTQVQDLTRDSRREPHPHRLRTRKGRVD